MLLQEAHDTTVLFAFQSHVYYNGHIDEETPILGFGTSFQPADVLQIVHVGPVATGVGLGLERRGLSWPRSGPDGGFVVGAGAERTVVDWPRGGTWYTLWLCAQVRQSLLCGIPPLALSHALVAPCASSPPPLPQRSHLVETTRQGARSSATEGPTIEAQCVTPRQACGWG